MPDRMLKTTDLAERWQLPPKTLAAWRQAGTGPPFVRIGKHVRYRESAVDAWLATQDAA